MRMKNRLLSILMAVVMVVGLLPTAALAAEPSVSSTASAPAFSDMPSDWSTAALTNAVANGLLNGDGGKILPNSPLSRAQMAAIIARAFGATAKGDLSAFSDVPSGAWYADSMAKAYKMGVIQGGNGKMNPESAITRQEVFVILARALKLGSAETVNKTFTDAGKISAWAKGEVYALINGGYIQGSNGALNPLGQITRAEFAKVLDNLIKQYIKTAGEYTTVASGSVMVNVSGVTLKNLTVGGDLIIGDGVGDGEVTLDNVKVEGRMVVRGGGVNSIIIKGASDLSSVIVARVDGKVSVKVQGGADVEVIYIDDGSDDVFIEGKVGSVQVETSGISVTATGATIGTLSVTGSNTNVIVGTGSTVTTLSIGAGAANNSVQVAGTVTALTSAGSGTSVTGSGTVTRVQALSGSSGTSVKTPNTQITADSGASGVTGGGGAPVAAGSTGTNNTSGSALVTTVVSSGGGGGGDSTPSLTITEITVSDATTVTFKSAIALDSIKLDSVTVSLTGSTAPFAAYASGVYTITLGESLTLGSHTLTLTKSGYNTATRTFAYAGKIEQDPGKTGGDATISVSGSTATFGGEIAFYGADTTLGRAQGHRVGVKVTAPAGMTDVSATATLTIGSNTYGTADDWMDGANFFYYYPLVTEPGQEFPFTVKWDGTNADNFIIKIAPTATLEGTQAEPNNDADHAALITVDAAPQTHWIYPNTDADWFKFEAQAGTTYMLQTTNLYPDPDEGLSYEIDTVLTLYGSDKTTKLTVQDDSDPVDSGYNYGSRIDYTFTTAGTYYLKVVDYNNSEYKTEDLPEYVGRYDIEVAQLTGEASVKPTITEPVYAGSSVTVGGTAEAGATIFVRVNGRIKFIISSVGTDEKWACTFPSLVIGDVVSVSAIETGKNVSEAAMTTVTEDPQQAAVNAVAAGITSITAPAQDATSLTLPTVDGHTVVIKSSTNLNVIALNGTVTPCAQATSVSLVLTVTNTASGKSADTAAITVVVPRSSTAGTIEQDPGKTGGNATVSASGNVATFGGEIAFYVTDATLGRAQGHRVGVKVTAPAGMTDVRSTATLTIGDTTYLPANNFMDGANYFYYYPLVTAAGQEFPFTVKWDGTDATAETYTIKIASDATLAAPQNTEESAEAAKISVPALGGIVVGDTQSVLEKAQALVSSGYTVTVKAADGTCINSSGVAVAAGTGSITFTVSKSSGTTYPEDTASLSIVVTDTPDTTPPTLTSVTPAAGVVVLDALETFKLTVDASDAVGVYSLEVDHSLEGTLPEFTVYANANNPYGTDADKAEFESYGVIVTYSDTEQKWTIDFGTNATNAFVTNHGITFYFVIRDTSNNAFGSMGTTTPENTFAYTVSRKTTVTDNIIAGLTAPATGGTPVTAITDSTQYTGTVTWDPAIPQDGTFAAETVYTATVTLTAKDGFTFTGVSADFFTVDGDGATSVTNDADTGVITVVFPATAADPTLPQD